jgi:flagellar hook-length control protein FliK
MEALPVDHPPRQDSPAAKQAASGPLGLFDLILNEESEPRPVEASTDGGREAEDRQDPTETPVQGKPVEAADEAGGEEQAVAEGNPTVEAPKEAPQEPPAKDEAAQQVSSIEGTETTKPLVVSAVPLVANLGQTVQNPGPEAQQAATRTLGRPEQAPGAGLRPSIAAAAVPTDQKGPATLGTAAGLTALSDDARAPGLDPLRQATIASKVALAAGGAGPKPTATVAASSGGASRTSAQASDAAAVTAKSPATAALSKDTLLTLAVDPVAATPTDAASADPLGAGALRPVLSAPQGLSAPTDFAGLVRGAAGDPRALLGGTNEQVAVQIRKAVSGGNDRISIRLHPAELGRLQVKLEVADDGHVRALITAERAETLDLMQRDLRGLERALQDAGLKTDSSSLSFTLQDQQGEQFLAAEEQRQDRPEAAERDAVAETELDQSQTHYWSAGEGRLDIRI